MIGRVLWYNSEKETGEIASLDNSRFFFLLEDVVFKSRKIALDDGVGVEFSVSDKYLFGKTRARSILVLENKKQMQLDLPGVDGQV